MKQAPSRNPIIAVNYGFMARDSCPKCKETRVTSDIHTFLTFLCGYSGTRGGIVHTPCQGTYFHQWYENQETIWEGIW